jgi:hypothetical protein
MVGRGLHTEEDEPRVGDPDPEVGAQDAEASDRDSKGTMTWCWTVKGTINCPSPPGGFSCDRPSRPWEGLCRFFARLERYGILGYPNDDLAPRLYLPISLS